MATDQARAHSKECHSGTEPAHHPASEDAATVAVFPSSVASGAEGLVALKCFVPEQVLFEELPIVVVERSGVETMREVFDRLVGSGQHEALLRHGSLFIGPPSGPHDEGYREWASRCLTDDVDADAAVESMLALSFNAYGSTPGGRFQMIYPTISKANHSCMPNACVLAPEEGPGRIVCLRDIAVGEEVLVSYLNDSELASPALARNRHLLDNWEFECACQRCQGQAEDVRRFACPLLEGCTGSCQALRPCSPQQLLTSACSACGGEPSSAVQTTWGEHEREMEALLDDLPSSLYSAWALSEEFSAAHPEHWLAGRWKRHLAAMTESNAKEADTPEEAEELHEEAVMHREAAQRCSQALLQQPPSVTSMAAVCS